WGAHSQNMFFESRNEKGSAPEVQQRTYMLRTERWFTGGTRNPANCPTVTSSLKYNADNVTFHGMSTFMTAKSTLKWNLDEEPFITYFNLGNGKFFNWMGEQANDRPWYNVGVQDYLPTWRWWFASTLLGRENIPTDQLDAEFIWDDAYVGGSCMRVYGTTADEYLHLFKTEYTLKENDVITVRYKLVGGAGKANLVLTAKGNENTPINESDFALIDNGQTADADSWVEKTFKVSGDLVGKDLALIALHFSNANDMNLYLGEMSIVRGTAVTPEKPEIISSKLLAFSRLGVDGKLIFKMPNDKPAGEPCYNSDVNTSLFKLYAQQEGGEKILMGITTSWAGMYYSIPLNLTKDRDKVRLGVSAVSMDMKSESEIAWSENFLETPDYVYSDDIAIDKTVIKPNENFTIKFVDPLHPDVNWTIEDANGKQVAYNFGKNVEVTKGLSEIGTYDLVLDGYIAETQNYGERRFKGYLQITSEDIGALPRIDELTANGQETSIQVNAGDDVLMAYKGRKANGQASRGLDLKEKPFAFKGSDAGVSSLNHGWTVSFWTKFNSISATGMQILDMRDQRTSWPQNNWGVFWSQYYPAEKTLYITLRNTNSGGPENQQGYKVDFIPGSWTHVTYVFTYDASKGASTELYIDGKKATPTTWKIGDDKGNGKAPRGTQCTASWSNAYVMIGSGRHGIAAMDAVIDDVKVFDAALTDEQVANTMKTSDVAEAHLKSYWDFEAEPLSKGMFGSANSTGFNAGYYSFAATGAEGQSNLKFEEPVYNAGCPFVKGTVYKVTTEAQWKAKNAVLSDVTGDDQQGSAHVTYAKDGEYEVVLTLKNSYGSDTRTFKVIRVGNPTGIGHAEAGQMNTYAVDRDVFVEFADAGKYAVQVYNAEGMQVADRTADVVAGAKMRVHVGNAGVYVLRVVKDGKTVRTVKLICK
ncbi:MAG TPA: LamG-like jellyroll fold domain-containing protein, partial [Prevotella sp.]